MGIETEFGITCVKDGRRRLNPDEISRYLFRPVVEWGRSSNVFLPNGSRLYLDVGSHPEYATAECDGLHQLVVHDRAGERILDDLAIRAEQRLEEEGIGGEVFLFKNNVDSMGNSYGCHENLLVSRDAPFRKLAASLVPFLVTRQLICGAGKILVEPESESGARFCLSQRADHMWEGISSATTRSRPIINTRDEPHADPERFRRLHVIVGDSNMSETTTMLKVGTVVLMLEMLEAGIELPDYTLDNPTRAIRWISHDPTGRREIPLDAGGTASALTIQRAYHRCAGDHLATRVDGEGIPNADLEWAHDLWGRMLDAIESGDFSRVDTEIDWVIKKKLIDRYVSRHGWGLDHPRIAQIDLTYHDIRPGRGLFSLLERRGLAARLTDSAEVEAARDTPPATTRARLRGEFVRRAVAAGRAHTVDWVHLKLDDDGSTVMCTDPFLAVDERVDRILATLDA